MAKLYLIPHITNEGLYVFTNKLPDGINNKFIFNLEKPHNFLEKFNIKYKYGNNKNWKSLKNLDINKNEKKELLHKIVSIGSFQIPLEKFVEVVNNRDPTSVANVNSLKIQSTKQKLNHIVPKPTLTIYEQKTANRFKKHEEELKKTKKVPNNNFGNLMKEEEKRNKNIKL
jgi:hypothetical protein